jgi:hypothetical protein
MDTVCAVFVCNKAYFHKLVRTMTQLVTSGNYKGDICLVIGNDLLDDPLLEHPIIKDNAVIIKHFPDIAFPQDVLDLQLKLDRKKEWNGKMFQFHKFYLFSTYFKKWDYVFYVDAGMWIFSDIMPIVNQKQKKTLLSHSDAYPDYVWKLDHQFDKTMTSEFKELSSKYNLNVDYFQTSLMIYDTDIIEDGTVTDLINLFLSYPISITNDQGIIALYYTNVKPYFKQLHTSDGGDKYYYDYLARNSWRHYAMLKMHYQPGHVE